MNSVNKDFLKHVQEVLEQNVKFMKDKIPEYLDFLVKVIEKWENSSSELKEKYAYNIALLKANSKKTNVVKAKLNSFYAYLVYKGYTSAYRLMKDKIVSGGESIYTWLRMYRELLTVS